MTENEINFAFELQAKLKQLVEKLALDEAPLYRGVPFKDIDGMDFDDNGVEVKYVKYAGCGDYDYDTKYFSLQNIVDYSYNVN